MEAAAAWVPWPDAATRAAAVPGAPEPRVVARGRAPSPGRVSHLGRVGRGRRGAPSTVAGRQGTEHLLPWRRRAAGRAARGAPEEKVRVSIKWSDDHDITSSNHITLVQSLYSRFASNLCGGGEGP